MTRSARQHRLRPPSGRGRRPARVATWSTLVAVVLTLLACTPPPPPKPTAPVISSFQALGAPHVETAVVPVAWSVTDPQGDPLTCRLDGDGDGTWDHTLDPCAAASSRNVTAAAGTHTARFEVSDGTHTTTATATYAVAPPATTEPLNIEIRPSGVMDPDVLAAFQWAAARWEAIIVRGLPDMAVRLGPTQCGPHTAAFDGTVDDLVVDVSMQSGIPPAAWASPCVYGTDSLPRYSWVEFNSDILADLKAAGFVDDIALHELGHALGFGVDWMANRTLVAGPHSGDPRFIGPRAVAEYAALGGTGGIPIMTINGAMQPHWESLVFGVEIMTAILDGTPVSRMTIASMADLGYAVDLDAADPYSIPPIPGPPPVATAAPASESGHPPLSGSWSRSVAGEPGTRIARA